MGIGGGSGMLNLDDTELGNLTDGFSSITIGDAAAGDIDIDTATFNDPLNLMTGGEVHDGAGTDIDMAGGDTVTINGTVAPGQSPGILLVHGNFAFADNATFEVEIGGSTPGDTDNNHDQLDVTGAVTIGSNVTLSTSAGNNFVPSGGDSFVIINNDSSDAITGTFAGLAEGATILSDGTPLEITYAGGDSNDVVLSFDDTPVLGGTTGNDDIHVTINGGKVELRLGGPGGTLIMNTPLADLTSLTLNGLAGNDDLEIDYSNGFFDLDITFNGGDPSSGSGDSLTLTGGTFTSATYNFTNASDGSVGLTSGGNASTITFTGLEPITSTITATNVTLNYSTTAETITVTDAGGGQTTVASTAAETVTFNNPTGTLTINAGDTGDDTINITSLAANYPASLTIDGQGGTDTVNFNGNVSLAPDKNLSVTADTINVNSDLSTGASGAVALTAGKNISLTSGSSITTADGGITLNANQGPTQDPGSEDGIHLDEATITSVNGNILLRGRSGSAGGDGIGVDDATISSTGTGAAAGTITLIGVGASDGVFLDGETARIASVEGDISIQGQGDSEGVYLFEGAVLSTGTTANAATITVNGTGVAEGVEVAEAGVISYFGDISITGMSSGNHGVELSDDDGIVASVGTGPNAATITLTGTTTDAGRHGVEIDGSVVSVDGSVTITGTNSNSGTGVNVAREDDYAGVLVSLAAAQNLDGAAWNLASNPDITDSTTIPHVTVNATGDGTFDVFSVTAGAGDRGIFDTANNTLDTFIYLFDAGFNLLVSDDDTDDGDGDGFDSLIDFTFAAAGTYFLVVGEFNTHAQDGALWGETPKSGDSYDLHVSIENHALNAGADPLAEVESNDATVGGNALIHLTAAATLTITGNGTADEGVTIDERIESNTGTVTILSPDDDILFENDARLVSASGTVTIHADTLGGNGGRIDMTDGSQIQAGTGLVDMDADGDILLSSVTTTTQVQVTSATGSILR